MTRDRPVAASADVGSPELAAALSQGDAFAVAHALQTGWVVVPVIRRDDGGTDLRLFRARSTGDDGWELPLFSSAETLRSFLASDPGREFEFVYAPSLTKTLAEATTVTSIVLDPAGPHPARMDREEVRELLASSPRVEPVATGIRERDRVVDLLLPLGDDWERLDLTEPESARHRHIAELLDRQLVNANTGPILRVQLGQWLRRLARAAAAGGGRETAFLVRRTSQAALALSLTQYWNRLGTPVAAGSHFERLVARLNAEPDRGEIVTATTATGRLLRRVRVSEGGAQVGADDVPILLIDYWLEFPDQVGLCLVSFASPHATLREHLLALADEIVVASTWVVSGTDAS